MIQFRMLVAVFFSLLMLAACGGSDSFSPDTTNGGGEEPPPVVPTEQISLGSGSPFTPGTLELGLDAISAGGTTSISARLVDSSGDPIDFPVAVSFTSQFAALATPGATIASPVNSIAGAVNTSYVSTGTATGVDVITATVNEGGQTLTATASIMVVAPDPASINFVSATPENINLKGMGNEVAVVKFQVLGPANNPVVDQLVDFSLNTDVGGLQLLENSQMSNADGEVTAYVQAGTMGTAVRVTAQLNANPSIRTQSERLVVSTGIPDQNSFSLSIENFNPEAWNFDGVEVPVTVHAADRFNNPVPDGTAIYFTTNGGAIESSCFTANGVCGVNWRSQNPRPANGRAIILAHAIGEESFIDLNGNGVFDDGDVFNLAVHDLPEVFLDINEDGIRDGDEPFVDFNANGFHDLGDESYNGLLCAHSTLCGEASTIHVRDSGVIVMAASDAVIEIEVNDDVVDEFSLAANESQVIYVKVTDINGNKMPSGTSIAISPTTGFFLSGLIVSQGVASVTVENSAATGPSIARITVTAGATTGDEELQVLVTSPSGKRTERYIPVTITAAP